MTTSNKKSNVGCLQMIGNLIWFFTGGLISGLAWGLLGVILCITIIGIPFGRQCFKFAKVSFFPFGKVVKLHYRSHAIMNTIWLILFGWEMFLMYMALMFINLVSILGIPNVFAVWKICKLSIAPFGAQVD